MPRRCKLARKGSSKDITDITRNTFSGKTEDEDGWVFDTIKAPTIAPVKGTQKRRKLSASRAPVDIREEPEPEELMKQLTLENTPTQQRQHVGTMVRAKGPVETSQTSPSVRRPSGSRRPSTQQKQPLGLNLSYGNSPSTVRQFRRVSVDDVNVYREPEIADENTAPYTAPSSTVTKEALLGRRAYNKAIGLSCQEVLANTGDQEKREAISRLAEAFSELEMVDPEGLYHVMKAMFEKVQADSKLQNLMPTVPTTNAHPLPPTPAPTPTPSSRPATPSNRPQSSHQNSQQSKLILANNNPHLKSHRRRQSSQAPPPEAVWSPNSAEKLPGQYVPGMEHTKQLADVMYERWTEGLRNRWPGL